MPSAGWLISWFTLNFLLYRHYRMPELVGSYHEFLKQVRYLCAPQTMLCPLFLCGNFTVPSAQFLHKLHFPCVLITSEMRSCVQWNCFSEYVDRFRARSWRGRACSARWNALSWSTTSKTIPSVRRRWNRCLSTSLAPSTQNARSTEAVRPSARCSADSVWNVVVDVVRCVLVVWAPQWTTDYRSLCSRLLLATRRCIIGRQ